MTSEFVRSLRGSFRLTQAEFSKMLGVHIMTVSKWETGRLKPDGIYLLLLTCLDMYGVEFATKLAQAGAVIFERKLKNEYIHKG